MYSSWVLGIYSEGEKLGWTWARSIAYFRWSMKGFTRWTLDKCHITYTPLSTSLFSNISNNFLMMLLSVAWPWPNTNWTGLTMRICAYKTLISTNFPVSNSLAVKIFKFILQPDRFHQNIAAMVNLSERFLSLRWLRCEKLCKPSLSSFSLEMSCERIWSVCLFLWCTSKKYAYSK